MIKNAENATENPCSLYKKQFKLKTIQAIIEDLQLVRVFPNAHLLSRLFVKNIPANG